MSRGHPSGDVPRAGAARRLATPELFACAACEDRIGGRPGEIGRRHRLPAGGFRDKTGTPGLPPAEPSERKADSRDKQRTEGSDAGEAQNVDFPQRHAGWGDDRAGLLDRGMSGPVMDRRGHAGWRCVGWRRLDGRRCVGLAAVGRRWRRDHGSYVYVRASPACRRRFGAIARKIPFERRLIESGLIRCRLRGFIALVNDPEGRNQRFGIRGSAGPWQPCLARIDVVALCE